MDTCDCFKVTEEDGNRVITLRGDFDFSYSAELEKAIEGIVAEGTLDVVVDMGQVGFIGSTIVGVLLGCAGRFRRRGGELKVCSVPPGALDVFDLLGVHKFVAVFDTRRDALRATAEDARQRLGIPERRSGEERRTDGGAFDGPERRGSGRRKD